jgi:hypothetical protein
MIIEIGVGETSKGPSVVINMIILDIVHLTIMKNFHDYLTISFLSPTHIRNNYVFINQETYDYKF